MADWTQIGRPSQVVICHMRLQEVSIQTSPRLAPSFSNRKGSLFRVVIFLPCEIPSWIRGSFIVHRVWP